MGAILWLGNPSNRTRFDQWWLTGSNPGSDASSTVMDLFFRLKHPSLFDLADQVTDRTKVW